MQHFKNIVLISIILCLHSLKVRIGYWLIDHCLKLQCAELKNCVCSLKRGKHTLTSMFHALNSSSVEITPIRKVPLMMKMMKMMVCAGPVLHAADGRLLCSLWMIYRTFAALTPLKWSRASRPEALKSTFENIFFPQ